MSMRSQQRPANRTTRPLTAAMTLLAILLSGCQSHQAQETAAPDHITQPVGPPAESMRYEGALAAGGLYRIEPRPEAGFHWPYFLAMPKKPKSAAPIYVQPNNDGRPGAPFKTHLYWASIINEQARVDFGNPLGLVTLTPVFPRPLVNGPDRNLYVHALSRAAMLAREPSLRRPDLQLLAMIDDARQKLARSGHHAPPEVVMWGFSAAGDFVTRMAVLHPERVRAVAAGGLGGLPILPVERHRGQPLTYPVGVGDLEDVTGRRLDADGVRATPILLIQGGADENDSVPEGELVRDGFGSDSYDFDQTIWINANLGRLPVDRVDDVRALYQSFGMRDFAYVVFDEVKHRATKEIESLVREFLRCVLLEESRCASRHANSKWP